MTQSLFLRSKMSELSRMQTQSAPLLLQALRRLRTAPRVKAGLLQRTQGPPALQSQISPCYPSLSEDHWHRLYFSFLSKPCAPPPQRFVPQWERYVYIPFPAWLALPHSPSLPITITSSRKTHLCQKRLNLPVLHFHCGI